MPVYIIFMNTTHEYEGRQVKRLEFPFGDWGKFFIDTQFYKEGKRYLNYTVKNLSDKMVTASKGMHTQEEIISIIRKDYEELGKAIEEYIQFLEDTEH